MSAHDLFGFSFDFSGFDLMIYFTILKAIISLKGQYLSIFITNVVTPTETSNKYVWSSLMARNITGKQEKYITLNNKCLPIFIGLKEFMSKLQ